MLLTAQRVRSPWSRKEGINAFLFHHGAESAARIDWATPDLERVLQEEPGELVAELVDVVPGGNAVESYLDVLAPDGTSKQVILAELSRTTPELILRLGSQVRAGPVTLRLDARHLPASERVAEIQALKERLAALLAAPTPTFWHDKPPLVVRAGRTEEGWRYYLEDASAMRVRDFIGEDWNPPSVTVNDDVKADFQASDGDLLPQVLPTLVGLSAESALLLGGVVVRGVGGELLNEWPARVGVGIGYCLNCHRHHTLVSADHGLRCSNCEHQQVNDGLWVATLT
ncbi:MAG: hypothetical protein HYZ28_12840 [Myxococcales bacterium]|nr:hypothetical protein [Myxococcales bacterium]